MCHDQQMKGPPADIDQLTDAMMQLCGAPEMGQKGFVQKRGIYATPEAWCKMGRTDW